MAASLGDLFPDQFKKDYIGRSISPKKVIIIDVPEFNLGYDKFMVLITLSVDKEYIGCVAINTNPSPNGNHVIISVVDHNYLDYDSHMNCTSITPLRIDWLKGILEKEPERIKGEITNEQHVEILQKLRAARTIAPITKQRFNL